MIRLLTLIFIISTSVAYGQKSTKKFLPKTLRKTVQFDMSFESFASKKDTSKMTFQNDGFRHVYAEKVDFDNLEYVVYYFDQDHHKPLYEVLLVYKDEVSRDAAAEKLLGSPNEGVEWRFKHKARKDVIAWTFQTKLIVAQVLDDTEWADEESLK